jgi:hypothetical protein
MRVFIVAAALCVGACATTYTVPSVRAPVEWTGAAGVEPVADTLEVYEGDHLNGDTLLRWQVEHVRTGRLVQDAIYGDSDREQFTLSAGTPVYAMQYAMQRVTTYGGVQTGSHNLNAGNNPIEWCALPTTGEPVCMFWEAPDRALYIEANGGMPLVANIRSPEGLPGTVPVVVEEAVDFGNPLFMEVRIVRVGRRNVQLATRVTDGTESQAVPGPGFSSHLRWDESGSASAYFFGGELRLESRPTERREFGAVNMSVVTPVLDPASDDGRRAHILSNPNTRLLMQMLEGLREAQAEEGLEPFDKAEDAIDRAPDTPDPSR